MTAFLALPIVALALKLTGLSRVQSVLMRLSPPRSPASRDAIGVVRMVELAARRGVWRANCLQRSLVAWWLLRRKGVAADIRIGVRKDAAGALAFHAWVELDGRVINDRPDIARVYASFDRPIVPRSARLE